MNINWFGSRDRKAMFWSEGAKLVVQTLFEDI